MNEQVSKIKGPFKISHTDVTKQPSYPCEKSEQLNV